MGKYEVCGERSVSTISHVRWREMLLSGALERE